MKRIVLIAILAALAGCNTPRDFEERLRRQERAINALARANDEIIEWISDLDGDIRFLIRHQPHCKTPNSPCKTLGAVRTGDEPPFRARGQEGANLRVRANSSL